MDRGCLQLLKRSKGDPPQGPASFADLPASIGATTEAFWAWLLHAVESFLGIAAPDVLDDPQTNDPALLAVVAVLTTATSNVNSGRAVLNLARRFSSVAELRSAAATEAGRDVIATAVKPTGLSKETKVFAILAVADWTEAAKEPSSGHVGISGIGPKVEAMLRTYAPAVFEGPSGTFLLDVNVFRVLVDLCLVARRVVGRQSTRQRTGTARATGRSRMA